MDILINILFLIAGAVLGVLTDRAWGMSARWMARHRRAVVEARVRDADDEPSRTPRIVGIIDGLGRGASLYQLTTTRSRERIPLIATINQDRSSLPLNTAEVIDFDSCKRRLELPYRAEIIEQRRRVGVELWDGPILYAAGREPGTGFLRAQVGNFFGYVDLSDLIFREVDQSGPLYPILEKLSGEFADVVAQPPHPLALSGCFACVFETASGPLVAYHIRSEKVVSARGLAALVPSFGMESNAPSGHASQYGVLQYNVLKEVLEEFFGTPELKHAADEVRVNDPDAIFVGAHAATLLREFDDGEAEMMWTGSAINLIDGSICVAGIVHFHSPEFYQYVRRHATGNDEGLAGVRPTVRLLPLFGEEIEAIMVPDRMSVSALFALDLARQQLADE